MDPGPGVPGLQSVESGLVETVISPPLAGEVKLGVLLSLPLLDGALDGQWELHTDALHVGLDLVQVFLAEMLHGISHGERLKNRHSVSVDIPAVGLGQIAAV